MTGFDILVFAIIVSGAINLTLAVSMLVMRTDAIDSMERLQKRHHEKDDSIARAHLCIYETEKRLVDFFVEYGYVKDEREGWALLKIQANKQPTPPEPLAWRQAMLKFGLKKIADKEASKRAKKGCK